MVPSLISLLLCDQVIVDARTAKKTLVGLFDSINLIEFPSQLGGFTLFARLADMEGTYVFRLSVVDLSQDKTLATVVSSEANAPETARYADLLLTVPPILFERPATHEFQLFANDIYLGRSLIDVKQATITGGQA
ncbi:MAG TPA: hypothetical protein VMW38_01460 [Terriglobia bacterium]|nr:hypothetical protein [Terriglobia bacterium]